jgi:peroxin-16
MSSLPARYESFLFSNASTIGTIESSLHSLTWFLPGRFKDAELISEARTFQPIKKPAMNWFIGL